MFASLLLMTAEHATSGSTQGGGEDPMEVKGTILSDGQVMVHCGCRCSVLDQGPLNRRGEVGLKGGIVKFCSTILEKTSLYHGCIIGTNQSEKTFFRRPAISLCHDN
jgi:hypothetical protein